MLFICLGTIIYVYKQHSFKSQTTQVLIAIPIFFENKFSEANTMSLTFFDEFICHFWEHRETNPSQSHTHYTTKTCLNKHLALSQCNRGGSALNVFDISIYHSKTFYRFYSNDYYVLSLFWNIFIFIEYIF